MWYLDGRPIGADAEDVGYVDTALPALGETTLQGGLDALKRAIKTLWFRPGYAGDAPDVFGVWADLYAAYQTMDGGVRIVFEPDPLDPSTLVIPVGTWEFGYKDVFLGYAQAIGVPTTLYLADGALLRNVYHLDGALYIIGRTTSAPQMEFTQFSGVGAVNVLTLLNGSTLGNEGSAPMIVWNKDAAADGIFILGLAFASRIDRWNSTVIRVDEGPLATQSQFIVYALLGAAIADDTIEGAGNAVVIYNLQSSSAQPSTVQPGWSGALPLGGPAQFQNMCIPRVRLSSTNPSPTAGAYTAMPGEFVRCLPDGSLTAINVSLPSAQSCPCAGVWVKRANNDILTTINILSADTVDGAASIVVPASLYAIVRVVSDGAVWLTA